MTLFMEALDVTLSAIGFVALLASVLGVIGLVVALSLSRRRAKARAEYAETERVCREQRDKQLGITPLSGRNQKRAA